MKLKWLKDKLGEKFYPISHATGVVVNENKTLDSKLAEIDTEIGNKAGKTEIPTELPANGGNADTVGGHTVKSDVPENAVFTDTVYDYSALLGYDIYNLVSLKDTTYPANKAWLSKDFVAPFDGFVFFMVQTDGASGAFTQVFKEDGVLISDNQKDITDFNTWGCAYSMGIVKGKTYHFGSYNNTATAFNKVMLCIRKKAEVPTEYVPYAPSNVALAEENTNHFMNLTNQENNGYLQKNLVDYRSLFADLSDNGTGTSHSYTSNDGVLKISRVANQYSGVYIYSGQITPLQGKDLIVSFDAKATVTGMKLNIYICDGEAPGVTDAITSDYKRYQLKIKAGYTSNNLIIYGNAVAGNVWIKNFMITEKYVTDTTYVDPVKSNMELDICKSDKSEITVNLFKPTLETTTVNGITVTNNEDGTFSVTGTATATTELSLGSVTLAPGRYKNIGVTAYIKKTDGSYVETVHTEEFTITEDAPVVTPILFCNSGETVTNIIKKPMITTNLNATIDDFVPYTGDSGSLNGDVADLRSDMYFEKEISLSKAQLIRNGSYSDINIISSLFLFGANGKFGLSRGYISLSLPASFSKKDEIYIKLPYKQYGYKKDDLLPYIYKTVFCTQGDFNGKIIGTCNLSYYSGSEDEGISLTIDINDNYSFTDNNISSAYVNLRF